MQQRIAVVQGRAAQEEEDICGGGGYYHHIAGKKLQQRSTFVQVFAPLFHRAGLHRSICPRTHAHAKATVRPSRRLTLVPVST
jgi:hypothetical protein